VGWLCWVPHCSRAAWGFRGNSLVILHSTYFGFSHFSPPELEIFPPFAIPFEVHPSMWWWEWIHQLHAPSHSNHPPTTMKFKNTTNSEILQDLYFDTDNYRTHQEFTHIIMETLFFLSHTLSNYPQSFRKLFSFFFLSLNFPKKKNHSLMDSWCLSEVHQDSSTTSNLVMRDLGLKLPKQNTITGFEPWTIICLSKQTIMAWNIVQLEPYIQLFYKWKDIFSGPIFQYVFNGNVRFMIGLTLCTYFSKYAHIIHILDPFFERNSMVMSVSWLD